MYSAVHIVALLLFGIIKAEGIDTNRWCQLSKLPIDTSLVSVITTNQLLTPIYHRQSTIATYVFHGPMADAQ